MLSESSGGAVLLIKREKRPGLVFRARFALVEAGCRKESLLERQDRQGSVRVKVGNAEEVAVVLSLVSAARFFCFHMGMGLAVVHFRRGCTFQTLMRFVIDVVGKRRFDPAGEVAWRYSQGEWQSQAAEFFQSSPESFDDRD